MPQIYDDDLDGSEAHDGSISNLDDEPSPRTSLLSSPRNGGHVETRRDHRRGPSGRYRKLRELAHSGVGSRDLLRLLVDEEYQSRRLRGVLYTALDRLEAESHRATQAERLIFETSQKCRTVNDAKRLVEQDAARIRQELELYKVQLGNAQREISRAQETLSVVEAQRDEAGASAARARTIARRLNEERLVQAARDEGRRVGFIEGLRSGRRIRYGGNEPVGHNNRGPMEIEDQSYHDDGNSLHSDVSPRLVVWVPETTLDHNTSPINRPGDDDGSVMSAGIPLDSTRTEGRFREIFSEDSVASASPPPVHSTLVPDPVPSSLPDRSLGRTPPIQIYSLPIPTHEELYPSALPNVSSTNESTSPPRDVAYPRRGGSFDSGFSVTSRGGHSRGLTASETPNAGGVHALPEGRSFSSVSRPTSRGVHSPRQGSVESRNELEASHGDDAAYLHVDPEEWPSLEVGEAKSASRRHRPPPMSLSQDRNSRYQRDRSVPSQLESSRGKLSPVAKPRVSLESPVPGITIEPPSRSPSNTPGQHPHQTSAFLSPEHANVSLLFSDDNDPPSVEHAPSSSDMVSLPPAEFLTDNLESSVPESTAVSLSQLNIKDSSKKSPSIDTWNSPLPEQNAAPDPPQAGLPGDYQVSNTSYPRSNHFMTTRWSLSLRSPLRHEVHVNEISPSRMAQQVPLPLSASGSPRITTSRVPSRASQGVRSSSSLSYVTDPFPNV